MRISLRLVVAAAVSLALLWTVLSAQNLFAPTSTITVTNTNDNGPGSLRQALADAQDGDTIDFDFALQGQTITLTSGELVVAASVTLSGPGPDLLAVARNLQSPNFRVLHLQPNHTVAINGLTLKNGHLLNLSGAGIFNEQSTVTVTNCVIRDNIVYSPPSISAGGGGIYNTGTLSLARCTVTGNSATSTFTYGGGGILNSGNLTINQSSITNNSGERYGGGLNGSATIQNSTISGNQTRGSDHFDGNGAGIYGQGLVVQNSTISGNSAVGGNFGGFGGGIYGAGVISNSTISGNTANHGAAGIYPSGPVELTHTILNSAPNIFNSGASVTSHGYNLSSDNGSGFLTGPGDQINTAPLLGPLQDNGGPTYTHAVLPNSPALNTGNPSFTPPPSTDQRGFPRVSNGRIDKGSFELQAINPTPTPSPPPPCTVFYDQMNNANGGAVVSQNFELANNIYDAQGADDFVVPPSQNWQIQQVKVSGRYFNGPGPAASANVLFYFDGAGFPGAVISGGTFNDRPISDDAGNLTISVPLGFVLTAGTYWVSVQANIDFDPNGEWAWSDRTVTSNSPAAWQNPGGGFATSCLTYGSRGANCGIDPDAPDQLFQILGCPITTTPINILGNVIYCPNPTPTALANATLTLSGSAQGMSSSHTGGNYQFAVPRNGSYTVVPNKSPLTPGAPGINTTDVVAVQRHFLNLGTPLSGCRLTAADVNGDGSINTVDVIAIQRFYLALSTGTANTGKYQFNPVNRNYFNLVTDQHNQNYDALVLGDVAAPYVAP